MHSRTLMLQALRVFKHSVYLAKAEQPGSQIRIEDHTVITQLQMFEKLPYHMLDTQTNDVPCRKPNDLHNAFRTFRVGSIRSFQFN